MAGERVYAALCFRVRIIPVLAFRYSPPVLIHALLHLPCPSAGSISDVTLNAHRVFGKSTPENAGEFCRAS